MNLYFYQDLISVLLGLGLLGLMVVRVRLKGPSYLLLFLVFICSLAGLTDALFRWNPNSLVVLMADSLSAFCYLMGLGIFLHYSLFYEKQEQLGKWYYLAYLPGLILSFLYVWTPLMVKGITRSFFGFQISYGPGYYWLIIYGLLYFVLILFFNGRVVFSFREWKEKERTFYLLFSFFLFFYFYSSVIIFPFLYGMVNFASPFPVVFAALVMVYAHLKYNYFSMV
jgi:hypothetical protein